MVENEEKANGRMNLPLIIGFKSRSTSRFGSGYEQNTEQ